MKTTYVSTQGVSNATRRSILDMQAELAKRQQEVTTGRSADVGLTLGARTGQTVSLRQQNATLQALLDANALAGARLDATQASLSSIADDADAFVSNLIDAKSSASGAAIAVGKAKDKLSSFINTLNAAQNGEYLFSGINSDVKPVADYFGTPPSAAKQAVDAAFQAHFGMAQSDPAVSTISATDMQQFLDTDFAALFDDPAWSANWSSASDATAKSRVSASDVVTTGASANDQGMRKLAMSFVMVADLGAAGLSQDTYNVLLDKATSAVSAGKQSVGTVRTDLGSAQEIVKTATDRTNTQMDVLAKNIGSLEDVDPYEAASRVNDLLSQIETAYTLTARIQKLSLLDYL